MKLYIDGQPLLGHKTGIGHYTNNLINELILTNISIEVVTNQIVNQKRLKSINFKDRQLKNIKLTNKLYPYKVIRRLMKHNVLYNFPIDLFEEKLNRSNSVFHATNFIMLPTRHAKQVVTIHDLAFMKFPDVVERNIYEYMMRWVPYSIEVADHIIADSFNTKKDILELFDIPKEKITVVHLAADAKFEKQTYEQITLVREKYNLPANYLLYLGTLEPKKNLVTLIDVYALLKQRYNVKEKLVIVGAKGWKFNPIFYKVKELNLEQDIIFMGYIADEDLASIYSGASVFTFPSLYEGFGIPLLEAMQCEVPVVASNTSCIPEIVGEAALLVNPYDIELWAEKIYQVISSPILQMDLISKGKQQASKFSWEKVALDTLKVYKKVVI
ncbi:glycosyltransferase family 4 protein [Lysinibacillus pakistanensis]